MSPIRKVLEVLPEGFKAYDRSDDGMVEIRLSETVNGRRMHAIAGLGVALLDAMDPTALRDLVGHVCEALRIDLLNVAAKGDGPIDYWDEILDGLLEDL